MGRAVCFCLSACCRALEGCWHRLQACLGGRVPTQAWPAGSTWRRHCRELHVTEQQKGGRKPLQVRNTPGLPWAEGGMLFVAHLEVTGNKHWMSAPSARGWALFPEVVSFSTRQISRKDICQRGEFNRLENLWLQFGPSSCPRTVSLREEFSYHGLPYQYGDQVPPLPTAL